jgi:hypothetical protein
LLLLALLSCVIIVVNFVTVDSYCWYYCLRLLLPSVITAIIVVIAAVYCGYCRCCYTFAITVADVLAAYFVIVVISMLPSSLQ